MTIKVWLLRSFLALALCVLAGCASSPLQGPGKTRSDALLQQQFSLADQQRRAKPQGRVIYAGFAMHSQSRAFRADVVAAEKALTALDPAAIVFKLDNPVLGQVADWPYATLENMASVLRQVATLARAQDKVVILLSTHGNVDMLGVNFDNKFYPYVDSRWLNQALAGLRDKPTLLLLSACFSGSFIEPLSSPSRVILTAAAKDRSSFGCQFESTNTYFVDALFNQSALQDWSVVQLMERAKVSIDARERGMKLSPSSLPQTFVGNAARAWANQPLWSWLPTP